MKKEEKPEKLEAQEKLTSSGPPWLSLRRERKRDRSGRAELPAACGKSTRRANLSTSLARLIPKWKKKGRRCGIWVLKGGWDASSFLVRA